MKLRWYSDESWWYVQSSIGWPWPDWLKQWWNFFNRVEPGHPNAFMINPPPARFAGKPPTTKE